MREHRREHAYEIDLIRAVDETLGQIVRHAAREASVLLTQDAPDVLPSIALGPEERNGRGLRRNGIDLRVVILRPMDAQWPLCIRGSPALKVNPAGLRMRS